MYEMSDLVDVTEINFYTQDENGYMSTNATVEFLGTHGNVKYLKVIDFLEDWRHELQERLKQEWSTTIIERGLSLERKSNNQF